MSKFIHFIRKHSRLPNLEEIIYAIRNMKLWEKLVFLALIISFLVSFLAIIWKISDMYMVGGAGLRRNFDGRNYRHAEIHKPGVGIFRRRQET